MKIREVIKYVRCYDIIMKFTEFLKEFVSTWQFGFVQGPN